MFTVPADVLLNLWAMQESSELLPPPVMGNVLPPPGKYHLRVEMLDSDGFAQRADADAVGEAEIIATFAALSAYALEAYKSHS